MPKGSKSINTLTGHRTKAELEQRENAEKALITGVALRERPEVNKNPIAHAEFMRVNELLTLVGKNDALIEAVINRYCLLQAECVDFEKKREKFSDNIDALMDDDQIDRETKYKLQSQMQANIISVDKQIQTKRKMLLDVEKESGLTIAAASRSIPKKVDAGENDPLLKALKGE